MNVVFIGSTEFGLKCLKAIQKIKSVNVTGIITSKPVFSISYNKSGVKNFLFADYSEYSNKKNIPFYVMENNMKEAELLSFITKSNPDFVIVAGWYHLIPDILLSKYKFGGLHASILPDYSGGAPLVWAMINGEKKTGITFFVMDKGVDSGPIIGQEKVVITKTDTIKTLYSKIEKLAIKLLIKYLPKIANSTVKYKKQNEKKRRVFPQRNPNDGLIDVKMTSTNMYNFIRAQTKPYPGAFLLVENRKLIIWKAAFPKSKVEFNNTSYFSPPFLFSNNKIAGIKCIDNKYIIFTEIEEVK